MKDVLRRYIARELLDGGSANAPGDDDDLLHSGVDSVGMMSLVLFIEEEWKLSIPPEDVVLENFESIARIERYLQSRLPSG